MAGYGGFLSIILIIITVMVNDELLVLCPLCLVFYVRVRVILQVKTHMYAYVLQEASFFVTNTCHLSISPFCERT